MNYYVLGMVCFLVGWVISYFVDIGLFRDNKKQSITKPNWQCIVQLKSNCLTINANDSDKAESICNAIKYYVEVADQQGKKFIDIEKDVYGTPISIALKTDEFVAVYVNQN